MRGEKEKHILPYVCGNYFIYSTLYRIYILNERELVLILQRHIQRKLILLAALKFVLVKYTQSEKKSFSIMLICLQDGFDKIVCYIYTQQNISVLHMHEFTLGIICSRRNLD